MRRGRWSSYSSSNYGGTSGARGSRGSSNSGRHRSCSCSLYRHCFLWCRVIIDGKTYTRNAPRFVFRLVTASRVWRVQCCMPLLRMKHLPRHPLEHRRTRRARRRRKRQRRRRRATRGSTCLGCTARIVAKHVYCNCSLRQLCSFFSAADAYSD